MSLSSSSNVKDCARFTSLICQLEENSSSSYLVDVFLSVVNDNKMFYNVIEDSSKFLIRLITILYGKDALGIEWDDVVSIVSNESFTKWFWSFLEDAGKVHIDNRKMQIVKNLVNTLSDDHLETMLQDNVYHYYLVLYLDVIN